MLARVSQPLLCFVAIVASVGCDTPESRAKSILGIYVKATAEARAFLLTASSKDSSGYFSEKFFDERYQKQLEKIKLSGKGESLSLAVIKAFEDEIIFLKNLIRSKEDFLGVVKADLDENGSKPADKLSEDESKMLAMSKSILPRLKNEIPDAHKILEIYINHHAEAKKIHDKS